MCLNWASRSGCWRPSIVFEFPCRLNPDCLSSSATVRGVTGCPPRVSSSASFAVDFVVDRSARIGSPRDSASTSSSNAATIPGSVSVTGLRPAPLRRIRPSGSIPAASSPAPRPTVSVAVAVTSATKEIPPWPISRAIAPSSSRRARSSRWCLTSSKTFASRTSNESRSPTSSPIPQPYGPNPYRTGLMPARALRQRSRQVGHGRRHGRIASATARQGTQAHSLGNGDGQRPNPGISGCSQ